MKRLSITLIAVLAFSFLFLALPENGYAQDQFLGCCQFEDLCRNITDIECAVEQGLNFFIEQSCNEQTGQCSGSGPDTVRNIPTLSEWGLIAMASILGLVGFIVMRRRVASA